MRQRNSQSKGPEVETGLACEGRVMGDEVKESFIVPRKGFALMLGDRGGWSVRSIEVTRSSLCLNRITVAVVVKLGCRRAKAESGRRPLQKLGRQ